MAKVPSGMRCPYGDFAAAVQGLTPSLDRKGFRVHTIVVVEAARQPALSFGSQTI
jgi:hypothetical protein